ncbi:uncharacterized protein LOC121646141 [Melanotaenia boesemani]|uniref:uncharacterized protein LOC121646141 n=1 Tax=Melanotaenia boesemani TaxID=1250792 RepID=UPI001C0417BF|nr:uncharacterized protein LOC121646141 [Melanotaenia boesemani]
MMGIEKLMKLLLLTNLLPTGVRCGKDSVFVYSTLRGEALLPCTDLGGATDCSTIDWTFFKGGQVQYKVEVRGGQVSTDSDKASRITVTSNCSIIISDLIVEDAASYVCKRDGHAITNVYLSLLNISSPSTITELRPGGKLVLSCTLFTYYDAGSCKSYSSGVFSVRWRQEDGTEMPNEERYSLIQNTPCNITLVTHLRMEDNNRRWTCQVNTTESSKAAFLDFTSSFLFQNSPTAQTLNSPAVSQDSSAQLPISRIVLCVALPLMVSIVGFYTWKVDHKRAKVSAATFEL